MGSGEWLARNSSKCHTTAPSHHVQKTLGLLLDHPHRDLLAAVSLAYHGLASEIKADSVALMYRPTACLVAPMDFMPMAFLAVPVAFVILLLGNLGCLEQKHSEWLCLSVLATYGGVRT